MSKPFLTLTVNGKQTQTHAQTLQQLLVERALADTKIATAVNGDFVPANRREATGLQPGDQVEIVAPRQGG